MTRFVALLVFMVLSAMAQAKTFDWVRPGADPYRGSDDRALTLLASDNLIPSAAVQGLRNLMRNGGCHMESVIPNDFQITRMLFGNDVRVPNVVARTSQWSSGVPRSVRVCTYRAQGGVIYILLRPDVCGNWSVRIVTVQGVCIVDQLLCDGKCEKIRNNQH